MADLQIASLRQQVAGLTEMVARAVEVIVALEESTDLIRAVRRAGYEQGLAVRSARTRLAAVPGKARGGLTVIRGGAA